MSNTGPKMKEQKLKDKQTEGDHNSKKRDAEREVREQAMRKKK